MSALVGILDRRRAQAVLIVRTGIGWRVGTGSIATGLIDGEGEAHLQERAAQRAAVALADRLDLLAMHA